MLRRPLAFVVGVVVIGCGGDEASSGGATGAAGAGGADAGFEAASDGAAGLAEVLCTKARPADGSSCQHEGLECTFGASTRPSCRVTATCTGGKWSAPDATCPPPGMGCPPTGPLDGVACADLTARCDYDTGKLCSCLDCPPGPPCPEPKNRWYCADPPSGSCPTAVPNLGAECDPAGAAACRYGSCATEGPIVATCDRGVWRWERETCPL